MAEGALAEFASVVDAGLNWRPSIVNSGERRRPKPRGKTFEVDAATSLEAIQKERPYSNEVLMAGKLQCRLDPP
jgi:hypothetical protein